MSILDMLDVAIGIVFMFLLLSLMAGAVIEVFSTLLNLRARMLESWILDLVKDPQWVTG